MKKYLFSFILSLVMAVGMFAQEGPQFETPFEQGSIVVGLTSFTATSQDGVQTPILDASFDLSVGYALTDQILVGLNGLEAADSEWAAQVFGRYYLSSPFFAQADVGYSSITEDVGIGLNFGVTGWLGNVVYTEPLIGVTLGDDAELTLGVNFGIAF